MAIRSSRNGDDKGAVTDVPVVDEAGGILTAGIASETGGAGPFDAAFAGRDVSADGTTDGMKLLTAAGCGVGRAAGVR